ncbi:Os01g0554400 [Oryza sativa Japonica Group]|uniref:Os01g0554400 protein n=1 Tax=Oryza sativa subsp. japonica TaxID=39947 RepID=C7IXC2_ORYSJ|nr:Os01g0554400 [Oryza sativa Japonica Group]|eukprot:NP_001172417.1 Os01g0554400 [Oryza sativa Japonica Group]
MVVGVQLYIFIIVRLNNNCYMAFKCCSDRINHMTWNGIG